MLEEMREQVVSPVHRTLLIVIYDVCETSYALRELTT